MDSELGTLLGKLIDLATSWTFEHRCSRCDVEDRRYKLRTVTLHWEYESGEYGEVLSVWPEFEVKPECEGVLCFGGDCGEEQVYKREQAHRHKEQCPFSEGFDTFFDHDVEAVLAMSRARGEFARLLGVRRKG